MKLVCWAAPSLAIALTSVAGCRDTGPEEPDTEQSVGDEAAEAADETGDAAKEAADQTEDEVDDQL